MNQMWCFKNAQVLYWRVSNR